MITTKKRAFTPGSGVALNPAEKTLLALIGQTDHKAVKTVSTLTTEDWEALIGVSRSQHLLPLLHTILQQDQVINRIPTEIRQTLKQEYTQNTLRNFQLYQAFFHLHGRLSAANTLCIPLKGIYLAAAEYENIGDRVCGDLDLLVPEKDLAAVVDIAEGLGYKLTRPVVWGALLQQRHHLPVMRHQQEKILIEWHWHLSSRKRRGQMPIAEIWERAVEKMLLKRPVLTLSPEDQLCHLASFILLT
jgi:hypothetical protein